MMNPFGRMYLRPGNLWASFQVLRMETKNVNGRVVEETEEGKPFLGILAEADSNLADRMRHRWDQDQHSLTHTLIIRGRENVRKEDVLIMGSRNFLVLLNDDVGSLGATGVIYLEERSDVKYDARGSSGTD